MSKKKKNKQKIVHSSRIGLLDTDTTLEFTKRLRLSCSTGTGKEIQDLPKKETHRRKIFGKVWSRGVAAGTDPCPANGGPIVKVKVIRNYDLATNTKVNRFAHRRRRVRVATVRERGKKKWRGERKWKRQSRKEGEKENSGRGNSFLPREGGGEREKLANSVPWLLLKIASLPRQRGNFPKILTAFIEMRFFNRATGVIPTFSSECRARKPCDPTEFARSSTSLFDSIRARVNKEISLIQATYLS